MMNSLDLLVIVFMAMSAASLLAVCLMFLVKNPTVKKVCFYLLGVQGMLVSWMNARMLPVGYEGKMMFGWVLGAAAVAALLLQVCGKNEKYARLARILVAVSVVLGTINAFML